MSGDETSDRVRFDATGIDPTAIGCASTVPSCRTNSVQTGAPRDHRPPLEQLALAARAVAAGRTRPALRTPPLPARSEDGAGRVRRHPRLPRRPLRQRQPDSRPRHAAAPALRLLAALRGRLADAAAAA